MADPSNRTSDPNDIDLFAQIKNRLSATGMFRVQVACLQLDAELTLRISLLSGFCRGLQNASNSYLYSTSEHTLQYSTWLTTAVFIVHKSSEYQACTDQRGLITTRVIQEEGMAKTNPFVQPGARDKEELEPDQLNPISDPLTANSAVPGAASAAGCKDFWSGLEITPQHKRSLQWKQDLDDSSLRPASKYSAVEKELGVCFLTKKYVSAPLFCQVYLKTLTRCPSNLRRGNTEAGHRSSDMKHRMY
ncbi:hypothetical protein Anapl_11548 [Anas platyrhynchos]|uniref:Uncharacterized protein n=1 Tax=Anas platyrhynchos TaxID=8839 RepID=R0LBX7_ANAPL|nr:hypothetical protein Anapl_11548 [Anas platyrhynchos]